MYMCSVDRCIKDFPYTFFLQDSLHTCGAREERLFGWITREAPQSVLPTRPCNFLIADWERNATAVKGVVHEHDTSFRDLGGLLPQYTRASSMQMADHGSGLFV